MKAFISKHKIIIMTVLTITLLVAGIALSRKKTETPVLVEPTAAPRQVSGEWGNLSDLVSNLGTPINRDDSNNKDGYFEYKSKSVNLNNEVLYQSNVPLFYKQIIDPSENKTSDSIKKQFGEPEIVLFGDFSEMGFNLYAYPSKGIAYIGSARQNYLIEVWYFEPTSITTFRQKWAPNYSLTPTQGGF